MAKKVLLSPLREDRPGSSCPLAKNSRTFASWIPRGSEPQASHMSTCRAQQSVRYLGRVIEIELFSLYPFEDVDHDRDFSVVKSKLPLPGKRKILYLIHVSGSSAVRAHCAYLLIRTKSLEWLAVISSTFGPWLIPTCCKEIESRHDKSATCSHTESYESDSSSG
eukprot:748586-Hanusia_phi.AAC.3